jgi:hypothetical protein
MLGSSQRGGWHDGSHPVPSAAFCSTFSIPCHRFVFAKVNALPYTFFVLIWLPKETAPDHRPVSVIATVPEIGTAITQPISSWRRTDASENNGKLVDAQIGSACGADGDGSLGRTQFATEFDDR